jgi:hypothetical protein
MTKLKHPRYMLAAAVDGSIAAVGGVDIDASRAATDGNLHLPPRTRRR